MNAAARPIEHTGERDLMTTTELPFDPDALREKYRRERDKRLRADGNEQYQRGRRASSPTTSRTRTSSRSSASRCTDEVEVVDRRRRLRRPARRRAPARGRRRGHPRHREGRRLRRHLVLEPLPRRDVRHRVVHLPAAARGGRLRPEGEVHPRARDPRPQPARSASTSTSTATPASRPRSPTSRWDDDDGRWIVSTNRGDRMRARFVVMANGPLHRPKLPAIPGIETFHGPHVPHQPLGLRLHRRRLRREPRRSSPTSASASSAPAPPPCSACPHLGESAEHLYVFQRTPSSIDVRDNRADRSRVGRSRSSPAGSSSGWTTSTRSCPAGSRTRTSSATAGPTSSASCS